VKFSGEQRLELQDSSSHPIQRRAMPSLRDFYVLRELDTGESAILSHLPAIRRAPRPIRRTSGAVGQPDNYQPLRKPPRSGQRLRHLSPFYFDKRVRLNAAKDAAASATLADAVVDAVILLTYVAVERRQCHRSTSDSPHRDVAPV
jgi:hypothetical protein